MNNAFIYCLAVAAQRYEVDIMNFVQMSNHLHDATFDRKGQLPAFNAYFHLLLAKCVNSHRGRWENVFSTTQPNVVDLADREALIDKLVYIATNPVKDGLVATVDEWPGASGYRALLTGAPLGATRPEVFFDQDGDMPVEVTLVLRIPPELGDHDEIMAEVRAQVEAFETAEAAKRAETGRRVMGRYAILRQSWRESPTSRQPRRGLRPTVASRSIWQRVERLQRRADFLKEYRTALTALREGSPIPFPYGTYLLPRHLGVAVQNLD